MNATPTTLNSSPSKPGHNRGKRFALLFSLAFIAAILAESALSIIGLGPAREMTLGIMIYWALNFGAMIQNMWWWWLTPVITLIVLFLSLFLVHLGLDEVGNPRLRTQAG